MKKEDKSKIRKALKVVNNLGADISVDFNTIGDMEVFLTVFQSNTDLTGRVSGFNNARDTLFFIDGFKKAMKIYNTKG